MPSASYQMPSASSQLPSASSQLPSASYQLPSASYQLPSALPNCNDWLIGAPWRQVSVLAAVIDQFYAEGNFGKRVKALLVAVFTTEEIVNNNTIGSEVLGKLDQNKLCAIREHLATLQPDGEPTPGTFYHKSALFINARCLRIRYGKGEKKSGEKAIENLVSASLTCTGNSVPPNPNSDPLHQNPNSEPPLNDDREHLDGDHERAKSDSGPSYAISRQAALNTSTLAVRTSAIIRKRLDTQLNRRHDRALSATHLQRQETWNKKTFSDNFKETFHGIKRVPALLYRNPNQSVEELNLQHLEDKGSEAMHDTSNNGKNLLAELPSKLEAKVKREELSKAVEQLKKEKQQ
ncbi:Hypp3525 [Branchiostoma lanceolatum]|uniref:Hypp3525 protein n=1 Tax=Branchiostoma lanceolatum TaxID=7740 RepID=A0A8K0A559_BRALA|nr:Hypp3525 [Branchiostoma lanceolatum]